MIANLRKWSNQLTWSTFLRFPNVAVALEGCGSGFNATNAVRTCLHFGTPPPLFIGKTSFKDIQSLSVQDEAIAKNIFHCVETLDEATIYGNKDENNNNSTSIAKRRPIIAIENFVPGCMAVDGGGEVFFVGDETTDEEKKCAEKKKLHSSMEKFFSREGIFEFPQDSLIVMGHENKGVSKETLEKADAVVFIPQFGTISSVNVVSCMGLMMFHYCLSNQQAADDDKSSSSSSTSVKRKRSLQITAAIRRQLAKRVATYQKFFQQKLPLLEDGTRTDPRPIHPSFFHLESDQIKTSIEKQIETTKTFTQEDFDALSRFSELSPLLDGRRSGKIELLELSVFFENFADQRNLGGLVRNSNAFLASVLYAGRRKINKQGTVGSDHYTNIRFLGPMKDSQLLHLHKQQQQQQQLQQEKEKVNQEEIIIEYDDSTKTEIDDLSQQDEAIWWLLDCNQEKLFENDNDDNSAPTMEHRKYHEIVANIPELPLESTDLVLEEILKIRTTATTSSNSMKQLIIVIPPEAGLPCEWILRKCVKRITIFRNGNNNREENGKIIQARGLPSQIASAIALHQIAPLCLI